MTSHYSSGKLAPNCIPNWVYQKISYPNVSLHDHIFPMNMAIYGGSTPRQTPLIGDPRKHLCVEYRWEMDEWIALLAQKINPESSQHIVTQIYVMPLGTRRIAESLRVVFRSPKWPWDAIGIAKKP